jgi:predicted enzyme related to lactoylglutathione lyase
MRTPSSTITEGQPGNGVRVVPMLTAVAIEATDARALAQFWAGALEWPLDEDASPGPRMAPPPASLPAALRAADGPIGLVFVPSARRKTRKNRLHLDLSGASGQAREVARLLGLGATRADIGQGDVPWDVLADPEGNEFCVLPGAESDGHLAAICLDSADPDVQGPFWAAATGWVVTDQGDWGIRLRSAADTGPALVMGPPVAPKEGTNRLQPCLVPAPGHDVAAEIDRLLAAGASRVDGPAPWMLVDPEGNEFRVADAAG